MNRTEPGPMRWRGSIVNPGPALGVGQSLWTTDYGGEEEATGQIMGFCCLNPEHNGFAGEMCAANDHGGWVDLADMLRYAADAMGPGCQVAFIVEPTQTVADGGA